MARCTSLLAAILLAATSAPVSAQASSVLPDYRPSVDNAVAFPDAERATRVQGAFVPLRNVVMVTPGMTKAQIHTLLDVPHFHEGLFGVRRWNYILNFYTGNGYEYVACQYQIRFDRRARVEGTWFREQRCADLLNRSLTPPAPTALASPAAPAVPLHSYDFTFEFDSSDLTQQGKDVLHQVAGEIGNGAYGEVFITGFTDTMGPVDYNDALAARRAAEAARYLRRLVSGDVRIYSRSSRDLEVPTPLQVRETANRRVSVELHQTSVPRPEPTTIR